MDDTKRVLLVYGMSNPKMNVIIGWQLRYLSWKEDDVQARRLFLLKTSKDEQAYELSLLKMDEEEE